MVAILPFVGHVVAPEHAAAVVAPPYDMLTEEQRTELAAGGDDSFLAVLPAGGTTVAGLRANARALERLLATGRFRPTDGPCLGVLSLTDHGARTVAIVGDVEVSAYLDGRVLPHEHVRADRVEQLASHLDLVGIASSPVCVVHRPSAAVTRLTDQVLGETPEVALEATDGVHLALHLVRDPAMQRRLSDALDAAGTLYVADGHHRAAAVAHHGTARVLTAAVPSDHLRVLAFHRRVDGLGDASASSVLRELEADGVRPEPLPAPSEPRVPGVVHLTVDGRWWAIDLRDRRQDGPVERLDVRLVERELLEPLARLGTGPEGVRIEPIPAPVGLSALVRAGSVGLALHPPDIEDVMAVADQGEIMPPKSTYLAPKLRSGLIVVPR